MASFRPDMVDSCSAFFGFMASFLLEIVDSCSAFFGFMASFRPDMVDSCLVFHMQRRGSTRNVMARIDDRHGVTEAYLETRRSIHVHYTGRWRAAADSHCLWIEGTKGSLKVDGRGTWWRKRGWRFFVPVRVGGIPGTAPPGFALDRATAYSRSPSAGADDRAVLGIALAALTSAMDRQPVSLADDAIEVAA